MATIRTRFVLLLVMALLAGGIGRALAEEVSSTPPPAVDEETSCEDETCEEPAADETTDPEPETTEPETTEPEPEPIEEVTDPVTSEEEVTPEDTEVAEEDAGELDGDVTSAQTATRATTFAESSVEIVDFDYQPGAITIKAGDTVTWTQTGEEPHTVTADDGSFDSGELDTGGAFSMRFDEPGTYGYYCTLHGGPGGEGMSGVVTVEGGEASEPPIAGNGEDDPPAEGGPKVAPTPVEGSLPNTGGGPPPVWVFALALVASGLTLWRVSRLAAKVG